MRRKCLKPRSLEASQSHSLTVSYGAVVLWFVLALMSKPMVVTLPCVLLLLDYWPLGRFEGANGRREFVRRGARFAVEKARYLRCRPRPGFKIAFCDLKG